MEINREYIKELYGNTIEDPVTKASGFDEIDQYFDSIEQMKAETEAKINSIKSEYDLLKATLDLKQSKLEEAQSLIAKHLIDKPVQDNISSTVNKPVGKITNEDIIKIAKENNDLK
jgi:hypothetical protein